MYVNIRPSRIQDPLEHKTHQKVLKMNIRPSYNREIMVRTCPMEILCSSLNYVLSFDFDFLFDLLQTILVKLYHLLIIHRSMKTKGVEMQIVCSIENKQK